MAFRPTHGRIWRISYPLIVAGVSETVVEVTDTVFLARYGITELAAIGLAGTIYGVALALIYGLVDGIQILVARRVGERRDPEVGVVFNQGLYLLAVTAAALILVLKLVVPALTEGLFTSADIHAAVDAYLQIAALALLPHAANLAFSTFYVAIGRTQVLMGATLVLAVTNIALDYLLIFGHAGFPELGIRGAAIASLTAELTAFLFLSADVWRRGYRRSFGLLGMQRLRPSILRLIGSISTPVSLEALVETLRWFLFFVIIEQLGEDVLAQANIIYSLYILLLIPVDGFSETVCSMTSNLIGQGRADRIGTLMRRTVQLSYLVMAPLLVAVLAFPEPVLSVFSSDTAFVRDILPSLLVIGIAALIAAPAETAYSAVAGTGDTRAILVFQVVITGSALSLAWYLALFLQLPLEYVWLSEVLAGALALLLSIARLRTAIWRRLRL
jgi:putative MATE family efflux protein